MLLRFAVAAEAVDTVRAKAVDCFVATSAEGSLPIDVGLYDVVDAKPFELVRAVTCRNETGRRTYFYAMYGSVPRFDDAAIRGVEAHSYRSSLRDGVLDDREECFLGF
ncbi:MAG TPA: hypothetical protein VHU80_03730 [Polyangiaceae bacterium]|nr:hypothetical protein [Polyangiaceae bacterium]